MENPVGMTVQQALIKLITEFLLQGQLAPTEGEVK